MENPVDGTDGKLGRGFMSADKLEEVDIGNGDKPRPTFISANLPPDITEELIKLLKEYKDCFAWDYLEMPGLDRSIVEHRLPIKSGFKPYKQPPRKIYKDEVLADVKKEVERLLDATHEAAVLEGICQWQAIEQDVRRRWSGSQRNALHHLQEIWHGP
jgi:hypothetical protein